MCVAVPGRVTWIGEAKIGSTPARIETGGVSRDVDLVMVPDAVVGDYVVVHSGYAIDVLSEQAAHTSLRLLGLEP